MWRTDTYWFDLASAEPRDRYHALMGLDAAGKKPRERV
jgi:hypothetical protein